MLEASSSLRGRDRGFFSSLTLKAIEEKELLKDRGIPLKGPEILEEIHTDAEQARKALWK